VKKDESLTRRSAEELVKKAKVLQSAFGGEGETFVLSLIKAELDGYGTAVPSLREILDKTLSAVKG
jgi:CRISPR system Cascade subunit CasC